MKKIKYYYEYRKYVYGSFDDVQKASESLRKRYESDFIAKRFETPLYQLGKIFCE